MSRVDNRIRSKTQSLAYFQNVTRNSKRHSNSNQNNQIQRRIRSGNPYSGNYDAELRLTNNPESPPINNSVARKRKGNNALHMGHQVATSLFAISLLTIASPTSAYSRNEEKLDKRLVKRAPADNFLSLHNSTNGDGQYNHLKGLYSEQTKPISSGRRRNKRSSRLWKKYFASKSNLDNTSPSPSPSPSTSTSNTTSFKSKIVNKFEQILKINDTYGADQEIYDTVEYKNIIAVKIETIDGVYSARQKYNEEIDKDVKKTKNFITEKFKDVRIFRKEETEKDSMQFIHTLSPSPSFYSAPGMCMAKSQFTNLHQTGMNCKTKNMGAAVADSFFKETDKMISRGLNDTGNKLIELNTQRGEHEKLVVDTITAYTTSGIGHSGDISLEFMYIVNENANIGYKALNGTLTFYDNHAEESYGMLYLAKSSLYTVGNITKVYSEYVGRRVEVSSDYFTLMHNNNTALRNYYIQEFQNKTVSEFINYLKKGLNRTNVYLTMVNETVDRSNEIIAQGEKALARYNIEEIANDTISRIDRKINDGLRVFNDPVEQFIEFLDVWLPTKKYYGQVAPFIVFVSSIYMTYKCLKRKITIEKAIRFETDNTARYEDNNKRMIGAMSEDQREDMIKIVRDEYTDSETIEYMTRSLRDNSDNISRSDDEYSECAKLINEENKDTYLRLSYDVAQGDIDPDQELEQSVIKQLYLHHKLEEALNKLLCERLNNSSYAPS